MGATCPSHHILPNLVLLLKLNWWWGRPVFFFAGETASPIQWEYTETILRMLGVIGSSPSRRCSRPGCQEHMFIYAVLYPVFNVKGKIVLFRAANACGKCRRTALLVVNTLRTGSFKLFERPLPEFLTILTL